DAIAHAIGGAHLAALGGVLDAAHDAREHGDDARLVLMRSAALSGPAARRLAAGAGLLAGCGHRSPRGRCPIATSCVAVTVPFGATPGRLRGGGCPRDGPDPAWPAGRKAPAV